MELPNRKKNRLDNFDYGQNGMYFITVCTKGRKQILCDIVGGGAHDAPKIKLSKCGVIVEKYILSTNNIPGITVEKYVIMPDHIHILLRIDRGGRPMVAPTISRVIQQMKGYITKKVGYPVWQKLFHDHIIRGEKDYLKIAEYIENNPYKWKDDCFYCE